MKTRPRLHACLWLTLCSALMASAAQVTFQIDLSVLAALGSFNPASDTVFVSGDAINNWNSAASQLSQSPTNSNLWVGTFDVTGSAGSTVQYKFIMNTASSVTWEGNVGPGGRNGNRTFTLADTDQILPVVYFNDLTNATSVSADVTFQVNMSVQIAMGSFDPAVGTVYPRRRFQCLERHRLRTHQQYG